MKPIFAIDITENKKNDVFNGAEFITKNVETDKSIELEKKQEDLKQTIDDSKLPLALRIIQGVCGIFGVIVLMGVLKAMFSIGFAQAYQNASELITVGAVCLATYIILKLISKQKEKNVLAEQDAVTQVQELQDDIQKIYDSLNIPRNAENVDVLVFKYKIKDGIPKAITGTWDVSPYTNLDVKLFRDDDKICIADLENVYSFNLSDITAIKSFPKRIVTFNWNKDVPPTDKQYKQYKLMADNLGRLHVPYNILEMNCNGEIYGIYFPSYELPAFERITGLRAE